MESRRLSAEVLVQTQSNNIAGKESTYNVHKIWWLRIFLHVRNKAYKALNVASVIFMEIFRHFIRQMLSNTTQLNIFKTLNIWYIMVYKNDLIEIDRYYSKVIKVLIFHKWIFKCNIQGVHKLLSGFPHLINFT